ncbi:DUF6712 family protein [Runella zeae]|uniref:DUF6712 family protein n=1 Tax=Runella zeae TaxID=94255 RepID=UPI00041C891D|nr:DUF6712 family protein [Runella zeae]
MALFKNIDDVYKHVGFNLSFEFTDIAPYLEDVEAGELIQFVGIGLYDRINNKLASDNPSLSEIEQKCLDLMRRYVSRLATVKWLPMGQVQFGRDGITTVGKSESRTAAYDQQIERIAFSLLELAASSLERLLSWLETTNSLTALTEYTNAPQRIANNKLYIKSAVEFSAYYSILDNALTFHALKPTISRIETQMVMPLLGDMYETLKGQISEPLQIKLRETVKYYIAFQTVAEVIELEQSIQLNANGLRVYYGSQYINAKYFMPPSEAQRLVSMQAAQRRAAMYWTQITTLLNEINGVVEAAPVVWIVSTDKIVGF